MCSVSCSYPLDAPIPLQGLCQKWLSADSDEKSQRGLTSHDAGFRFSPKEDYDRSIVEYGMAISIDRYHVSAYNLRGGLFSLQKQHGYAIVDYTSAINIAPKLVGLSWPISDNLVDKLASAYKGRGEAYFAKQQFGLAIDDFTAAIDYLSVLGTVKAFQELKIDDDVSYSLAGAFDYRGRASLAKGYYELAVVDFESVLRFDPYNGINYDYRIARRADEHSECGEYDLAITGYTLAIRIDPDYAGHYNKRGLAFFAKDEYDSAIADFESAISISPHFDEMIYENRDRAFRAKGNSESGQ